MSVVYLSLGSNLERKIHNLNQAVLEIGLNVGNVIHVSSFYHSKPCGFKSENDFVNAVAIVETELTPLELLHMLNKVEKKIGRKSKTEKHYSDRIIDIDILFYDNLTINLPQLKIPHVELHKRDFVLVPLMEVAPDLKHPVLKKTISMLYRAHENKTPVFPVKR
ncbi:MAG: 2-amino-4-hydroxy-6-hydroxymethyldihydropteridine diphosphokinase [Paludibacteraceae bacterium]